jgi:hypothetical protein
MLEALEQSAMLTVGVKKTNTAPLTRPATKASTIIKLYCFLFISPPLFFPGCPRGIAGYHKGAIVDR